MKVEIVCSKCGIPQYEVVALALLSVFGAAVSGNPTRCPDGTRHKFHEPNEVKHETL